MPDEFWDRPEEFDVERDFQKLKHHYAFGKGIHYCTGAPLARIEGQVALQRILEQMPNLRLLGEPEEISAHVLHGVETPPRGLTLWLLDQRHRTGLSQTMVRGVL